MAPRPYADECLSFIEHNSHRRVIQCVNENRRREQNRERERERGKTEEKKKQTERWGSMLWAEVEAGGVMQASGEG